MSKVRLRCLDQSVNVGWHPTVCHHLPTAPLDFRVKTLVDERGGNTGGARDALRGDDQRGRRGVGFEAVALGPLLGDLRAIGLG